jgi:hypothetical protein
MFKTFFWKTYQVKYTNLDRSLVSYEFFRGFTWEVVEMAIKEAKVKSEKEKQVFAIERIERIY